MSNRFTSAKAAASALRRGDIGLTGEVHLTGRLEPFTASTKGIAKLQKALASSNDTRKMVVDNVTLSKKLVSSIIRGLQQNKMVEQLEVRNIETVYLGSKQLAVAAGQLENLKSLQLSTIHEDLIPDFMESVQNSLVEKVMLSSLSWTSRKASRTLCAGTVLTSINLAHLKFADSKQKLIFFRLISSIQQLKSFKWEGRLTGLELVSYLKPSESCLFKKRPGVNILFSLNLDDPVCSLFSDIIENVVDKAIIRSDWPRAAAGKILSSVVKSNKVTAVLVAWTDYAQKLSFAGEMRELFKFAKSHSAYPFVFGQQSPDTDRLTQDFFD